MAERLGIHHLLVEAYRPYVAGLLEEREVRLTEAVTRALDEGETWLADQLDELTHTPFHRQRRGPLELFQEAMRFPTAALASEGVDPIPRDEVARHALPGDVYDLAPASSSQLGSEVWAAHLEWGAAKAAALRGDPPRT